MLTSIYDCTVDAKGRVVVPQNFRDELGAKAFVTFCENHCLCVYSADEYETLKNKIMEGRKNHLPGVKQLVSYYIQASWEVAFDQSGRITLTQEMRDRMNFDISSGSKIKIMGSIDHLEIWSSESYKASLDAFDLDELENAKIMLEI